MQSKVSPGLITAYAVPANCVRHVGFVAKPDKSVDALASQTTHAVEGRLLPNDNPNCSAPSSTGCLSAQRQPTVQHQQHRQNQLTDFACGSSRLKAQQRDFVLVREQRHSGAPITPRGHLRQDSMNDQFVKRAAQPINQNITITTCMRGDNLNDVF